MGRVQVEVGRARTARWPWALVAAALWAGSSGCATCKTPPPFYVALEASHSANAGAATRVLILQLKNLDAIEVADFDELRRDPAATLAETMVGKPEEIWVTAGEVEAHWVARDKDARHVAAVPVYQNPSTKKWWASHRLKPVPMLQCREVAVESLANRRPYSSEEQMRFYLDLQEISSDGAAPPPRPAESARDVSARKGKGA